MAHGSTQPFRASGTAIAACAGASASVALIGGGDSVLAYNSSDAIAFVTLGTDGAVTANPATDAPIPPGGSRLIGTGSLATWAAAVIGSSGTGSGDVYFSRGDGSIY